MKDGWDMCFVSVNCFVHLQAIRCHFMSCLATDDMLSIDTAIKVL